MQIITNQFQKELKQHGNEQFPFLVSYQNNTMKNTLQRYGLLGK